MLALIIGSTTTAKGAILNNLHQRRYKFETQLHTAFSFCNLLPNLTPNPHPNSLISNFYYLRQLFLMVLIYGSIILYENICIYRCFKSFYGGKKSLGWSIDFGKLTNIFKIVLKFRRFITLAV